MHFLYPTTIIANEMTESSSYKVSRPLHKLTEEIQSVVLQGKQCKVSAEKKYHQYSFPSHISSLIN